MSYGTVQAEKMTTESGYSLGAGNASSFKNRIINGGMVIDQRNAGASINSTPSSTVRPVDRFFVDNFNSGTVACARSTTAPAGFSNSLSLTVSSADTPASGDYLLLSQQIEGFNAADLNWGTANAKPITLSFWIRSSVAGTYGASIRGGSSFQSYPFSYTINAANTWEFETITIPGPTSGTFDTTNGAAFQVMFDLGSGTDFIGTANTWQAGSEWRVAGSLAWVSNAGATLFITGVQVELGTVATSFDFRSIGTELALCQRYFWTSASVGGDQNPRISAGIAYNATQTAQHAVMYPVEMRATPTINSLSGNNIYSPVIGGKTITSVSLVGASNTGTTLATSGSTGLTAQDNWVIFNGTLNFSAEL
jgi:hypothetical protein